MPRSREELVEALRELAAQRRQAEKYHIAGSPRAERLHREAFYLSEAADLLDSLEEREEYRAVAHGTNLPITHLAGPFTDEGEAKSVVDRSQAKGARVQRRRAITATPWTDIEEGTDGR